MNKICYFIISCWFVLCMNFSFGQQYDGVILEKGKVDRNNVIYTPGKVFVYEFQILSGDQEYYLKNKEQDTFKLTENRAEALLKEIHLTVIRPKLFQRTNRNQTQIIYSYEPDPKIAVFTGLVENETNIWLHPPRKGFFRALETCPFPYIQLGEENQEEWKDSMLISSYWSDSVWGVWTDKLLLNYHYKREGKERIRTNFGEVECVRILAKAHSEIGSSSLVAHFSGEYGFVQLTYTLFTGMQVVLKLKEVKNEPVLRDGRDFFESRW